MPVVNPTSDTRDESEYDYKGNPVGRDPVEVTLKSGGRLTAAERHALPKGDFALPGGRYPVNDPSHARNALARVSQFGSSKEKAEVRAKVHRKYPAVGEG